LCHNRLGQVIKAGKNKKKERKEAEEREEEEEAEAKKKKHALPNSSAISQQIFWNKVCDIEMERNLFWVWRNFKHQIFLAFVTTEIETERLLCGDLKQQLEFKQQQWWKHALHTYPQKEMVVWRAAGPHFVNAREVAGGEVERIYSHCSC